jgi:hypothetical protein
VTFVRGTSPIGDERDAAERLEAIRASEEKQEMWVKEGLAVLNTAIRAYRAGAHDPYATEVTRRDARRIRIGFGTTEQVQDGQWQLAVEPAPPPGRRTKRTERLRPAEAVAAVLSGRSSVLEAEDLVLRALVDLDNDRTRAAAHQVGAAMRLLPLELGSAIEERIPDFGSISIRAAELERTAGDRRLTADEVADLEAIVEAVDGALDAWRYAHVS